MSHLKEKSKGYTIIFPLPRPRYRNVRPPTVLGVVALWRNWAVS